MGGGGAPLHLTALKSTQTSVAHLSSSQPLTQCPFCKFFILKSFHVGGGWRPTFLRDLTLPPPVSPHFISVRPAWRVCDRPPAEILQSLRMLRWQRMVRQEDAAVVHHVGDAAHCQRLLKKIVVNQHVGRDHQVETLPFGNVHGLRHHVHVESAHVRRISRTDRHGSHRDVPYRRRN